MPVTDSWRWKHFFGCETKLKDASVPRVEITATGASAADEAVHMLERLLARQGRRLTQEQWLFVTPRVAVEPTALYVRLALRVVGKLPEIGFLGFRFLICLRPNCF